MREGNALQDSLPAIGAVERGKRSDELIEKRGLDSQKHGRRGRHLAALEAKEIGLLDRRDQQWVRLVIVKGSAEQAAVVLRSSFSGLQVERAAVDLTAKRLQRCGSSGSPIERSVRFGRKNR